MTFSLPDTRCGGESAEYVLEHVRSNDHPHDLALTIQLGLWFVHDVLLRA